MFDPYAESVSSTGEPPTVSMSQQETSELSLSNSSSRSLSVQEPDSGYEASPSSIADNQRFFGEQTAVAAARPSEMRQSSRVNSEEEFDIVECHSQILFSDSDSDELDDYDTCLDCSSSPVSCNCFRTDSSTTNTTAMSNCDNSRCNSSDLSFNRPSTQPIQIPILPSCRIRTDVNTRDIYPTTRSQPVDFSPLHRLGGLIPERLPLSWPSSASPLRNCRNLALTPSRSNFTNRDIPRTNSFCRRHNHPVRSRRQIIDSDASSICSSDEEGPEDVFNMPSGEASSYPTMITMSSVPLPDVVLESTDTGRRSRSMSINLPPDREQVLGDIGQRLRRMSDLFVQRRQFRMAVERARSRTASECDDHLHRNGLS